MATKRQRDAEAARLFLEQIGWTGEFRELPGIDRATLDRFWSKVTLHEGHWLWTRATSSNGAAQFAIAPDRVVKAHRLAWELMRGDIAPGAVLLRSDECPWVECLNPDCYREGSKTEAATIGGQRGGLGRIKSRPEGISLTCPQSAVDLLLAMQERGDGLLEIHDVGRRLNLGPAAIQHIIKGNAVGVR